MGISGLIPFLEKATEKTNLSALPRNSRAAIDAYCWLHKGAFACADQLARGEATDVHINYCLKYVKLLQSNGIRPILVFDGRHLPAKADTERKRRESRQQAKTRAAELLRLGRTAEARAQLRRCVDITHAMALQLIRRGRELGVDSIVAPYEADGQLAFLSRNGLADYVITEDSDLVLFGCARILFKLDLSGDCVLLDADRLPQALGCVPARYTFEKFRFMCILSGCDYVDSLPGIGLAKACKFVLMTAEDQVMRQALAKIPIYLNMRHLEVSAEYERRVLRANATFQHMVVFDPRSRRLVRLSGVEDLGEDEAYCDNAGEFFDAELAFDMALGNIDPMSLKRMDEWSPDAPAETSGESKKRSKSIWQRVDGTIAEKKTATDVDTDDHKDDKRRVIKFRNDPVVRPQPDEPNLTDSLLAVYALNDRVTETDTKLPLAFDPLEKSPNLSRNPFGVEISPTAVFLSPTKICRSNRSLLEQVSPVKRMEYASSSPHKATATKGIIVRPKRTAVDAKRNVLSRFFNAGARAPKEPTTEAAEKFAAMEQRLEQASRVSAQFYEIAAQPKTPEVTDAKRCHTNTPPTKSSDDDDDDDDEDTDSQPAKRSCRSLFSGTSQSESSAESTIDLTQKSPEKTAHSSTSKLPEPVRARKATCRQPGLSKGQSRLSAFGFMKKSL